MKDKLEVLWYTRERVGYVEEHRLFGFTFYARCGNVRTLFGMRWVK